MTPRTIDVRFTLLLAVLVTACTAPPAASDSAPIHGGAPDRGHPAVGYVMLEGRSFCTGTLITPSVVLTAAHCIEHLVRGFYTGQGQPLAVSATMPGVPLPPPPDMMEHPAVKKTAYPGWKSDGICPSNRSADVGLIRLAEPATGITPMPIRREGLPSPGTTCEAVGFGMHLEADGSTTVRGKRAGTVVVRSASPFGIEAEMATAITDHGDSGGPLICGGVVVGANSCATDGVFPQHRITHYGRIDMAAAWIAATIARWSAEPSDGSLATDGSMEHALGPEHDESGT